MDVCMWRLSDKLAAFSCFWLTGNDWQTRTFSKHNATHPSSQWHGYYAHYYWVNVPIGPENTGVSLLKYTWLSRSDFFPNMGVFWYIKPARTAWVICLSKRGTWQDGLPACVQLKPGTTADNGSGERLADTGLTCSCLAAGNLPRVRGEYMVWGDNVQRSQTRVLSAWHGTPETESSHTRPFFLLYFRTNFKTNFMLTLYSRQVLISHRWLIRYYQFGFPAENIRLVCESRPTTLTNTAAPAIYAERYLGHLWWLAYQYSYTRGNKDTMTKGN